MNRPAIPESLRVRDGAAAPQGPLPRSAPPRASGGRRMRRPGPVRRLVAWVEHHLRAIFGTLGLMARTPFSTLLTVAVIGIALALPAGLHVALENVRAVGQGLDDAARISLFLEKDLAPEAASDLEGRVAAMAEVALVEHISPGAALEEFQRFSGFGDALDLLQDNPLPPVLVVTPRAQFATPDQVQRLLERLRGEAGVDRAQLDMEWVKRLHALMAIGQRAALVLGGLLAIAVLLIVGNTIRLSIQSRREEIVVQKLIGATDAFVRRPFLYSGLFHGLFGAIFAWLLITGALLMLAGPVHSLSLLYEGAFEMSGLGVVASLALLAGGVLLGLLGAWLAVGRHVRTIEPA